MLILTGLVPWVGFAVRGTWDQGEMGVGIVLLAIGGIDLWRGHRRSRT